MSQAFSNNPLFGETYANLFDYRGAAGLLWLARLHLWARRASPPAAPRWARVAQPTGLLPPQCVSHGPAAGGANIMRQREALKLYKPILVVGTPGRIAELSRDGALQVKGVWSCEG